MKYFSVNIIKPIAALLISIGLTACGGGTEGALSADAAGNAAGLVSADPNGATMAPLGGCSGSGGCEQPIYSIGGTVSGLGSGKVVTLANNGVKVVGVGVSGTFGFSTRVATYAVTVAVQPAGQNCTVSNGSGTADAGVVTDISVACTDTGVPTYSVGGNVSGLGTAKFLVLSNAGSTVTVSASGAFTFPTPFVNGAAYAVTVSTLPVGQTCTVSNGSGTISAANVTNVSVACVNTVATYSIGGNVSGLGTGKFLVLSNAGSTVTVSASGPFTFPTLFANGAAYAVTVSTLPVGQTCTVSNGSGTISAANVTNVSVACVTAPVSAWSNFTTTATTLTLTSSEPLKANAPFFGIEVRRNGVDITDNIVNVEALTATSWRYTFQGPTLNTPGATISISLKNTALASPGHYVAVRGYGAAAGVQGTYQLLQDCQAGIGECAGKGAKPGLLAAVKGLSARYSPRDLETAPGVYNFSEIFTDAKFLADQGKKLHVMLRFKSFGTNNLYDGTGSQRDFEIKRSLDGQDAWDGDRTREVHVYVKNAAGVWNEAPFVFFAAGTVARLNTAPPAGTGNVNVVYSRDPFPESAWHTTPPIASWYVGVGGQNNGTGDTGGSHGHVYAPWRSTTLTWLRTFMTDFKNQWNTAVAAGTVPADAIESVSIQETANSLGDLTAPTYDSTYTVAAYRAGLFELGKLTARAVRRKALFGQLFNIIPQGNSASAMPGLANDIILWGARLEGPDLFNADIGPGGLETNVYENVHRAFNDRALTMIWQQNASYSEPIGTSGNFYTPAQQFDKARSGITDSSTPGGTLGLQAEYMFWNIPTKAPKGPLTFLDALPVIAANPVIQTTPNDHYRWRRAATSTPIADQEITRVNP